MNEKNHNNKLKIFFSIMIPLFILFNYTIISLGHTMTGDMEINNCTHMSSQLEGMFETIGIPVTLKTAGNGDGARHMWIRIGWLEIDSVSLFPVINTPFTESVYEYESFDEYEKTYT